MSYYDDDEERKKALYERIVGTDSGLQERKQALYERIISNQPATIQKNNKQPMLAIERLKQRVNEIAPTYLNQLEEMRQKQNEENRKRTNNYMNSQEYKNAKQLSDLSKQKMQENSNSKFSNTSNFQTTVKGESLNKSLAEMLSKRTNTSKEEAQKIANQGEDAVKERLKQAYIDSHSNRNKEINLPDGVHKVDDVKEINLPDGTVWHTNMPDQFNEDNSTSAKLWRNTQAILGNTYKSAETGVANFMDYSINVDNKIKDVYENTDNAFVKTALSSPRLLAENLKSDEQKVKERETRDEFQDTLQFAKQQNAEIMQQNVDDTTNRVTKKVAQLSESMGNNLLGAGLSAINPVLGTTYFIGSASGSYYDEAIERGMNKDQALLYGTIMGTLEGFTEEGIAGKHVKAFQRFLTGEGLKNEIARFGIDVAENFLQEAVMPGLSELTAYGVAGKEAMKYDLTTKDGIEALLKDSLSDGVDGALSSILMSGISRGVPSAIRLTNEISQGHKPTAQQIAQVMQDCQNAGIDTQNVLKNEILYQAQKQINEQQTAFYDNKAKYSIDIEENSLKNKSYTLEELDNDFADTLNGVETSDGNVIYGYFDENNNLVVEKAKDDGFGEKVLDTITVEQKDGKFSGKKVNDAIKKLSEIADEAKPIDGQIDIENNVQNPAKNQNNNSQQQITQIKNKNSLNQNVEGQVETKFSKILNNKELPMQSYVYEKSDNVKIDSLRQQASKYFNNSQEAHNFVDMLEKIITDKNISINLDTNLGEKINGQYKDGVITINPNSNRAGEFLAIHELTHAIGTDSMIKMVENYRKSNAEFDSQVKKLLQNYNQSEINEEALADVAGQLFGNQEYINNLEKTNPNVFKTIYNEIKYLWHQFTGYKNQDQFVDDLMFKWEQAYRKQNKENNNSTKYSIQTDSDGKQYVRVDTDQSVFEGIESKDYSKIARMYMQDYLKGSTQLTESDSTNIGNKGITKYTNPKQQNKYIDEKMKLTPELKNVLKVAEKVKSGLPTKDTSKFPNWEYYKFQFELGGKKFEGLINIGIDKEGKKHFYEINKIHTTSNSYVSTSKSSSTDFINNSIAPSNENVNTAKYSKQEFENNSVNLPKTDNKGNMLSKQQQEYFKDSKVRDENGKLKVVYHGTNNPGFTEFNRNVTYFTDNKDVANTYTGNNGVYEGYLNITNPITIEANGEKWSMIDINNISIDGIDNIKGFLDEYGASAWKEKGAIRTSTADLISAISDAIDDGKIDSDGVIIKNIYDEGAYSDSAGTKLGNDYVAFKSNQFKNKINSNPTTKNDIRYSKSEDNSNKTLLALHNLSEDKLKGILELGGFPVPSIAITNPDIVDHSQFGDISVVFDKDTINPANSQNEVYDRDVWSPTFPQVDYVINQDAIDTVSKNIGIEWWRLNDYAEDSKPDYLIEKLARNEDVIDKYIKDNNLKYEVAYKEPSFKRSYNNTEEMKKWANKNNPTLEELSTNQKLKEEYLKLTQLDKNSELYETLDSSLDWYSKDHIKNPWLTQMENDLNILTGKAEIQPEIDEYATRDNKERVAKQNGLEKYLKENIKDIYGERGIRNDRDIFTPSGNRRSFWQLHDEYNLENIVRNLVSQDTTGSENSLFTGFGKINAQMSNKFNSIEDIKNNQNRLMQDTENNNLEAYKETILEDVNGLADYYKYPDSGFGMQGYENASESIFELAKSKKLTVENFKKILTENVMNTEKIPDSLLNKVIDDLDNLKNLPTDYFEAKPQRAVGLDEVKAIVIPNNMNQELKQQLIDRGLNVVEYDANKEGDRQAKIKALDEYKFSKNSNTWQEYLEKEFPAKGTRTNFKDINQGVLPTKQNSNQKNTENKTDINLPPKVSANNQYKDTTTKVRKHYKSIIESQYTTDEARAISRELMGSDTYIPETNKAQLEKADERISRAGADSELDSLMARSTVGDKITSVDIAVGERLIQYYSKTGDATKLRDAIQATAMAGTTAGQTVQAMSLLNHQTPEGQAVWLQRSVEKMNNDLKKSRGAKAEQLHLTDEMLNKIVNSETTEELHKNLDEVYKELGQQVTKTILQKIDSWRYFSMLANPKTHIRNILGNLAMGKAQTAKNKVAGAIEGVVGKFNKNMERTHTIVPASKEVKQFAKADIKNVTDRLGLTENKYNPKSRIESNMKTFKHKALENTIGKAFAFNDYALSAEDGWGLKAGYAKALSEYMTANKLKPGTITDAQLAKARNYAVLQAKEATFNQDCQLATLINQLANKNKFAKYTVDAILPFKKTPMNIAKAGMEYSPMGLAKSMVYDTVQLRKGNITVNQYIDNVSKGLTGTGIALVGYALASMGIIKASGGDDDKEKYEQNQGKQTYSIQIGDNTYSLDWLAPTAIPLFIGAEIHELAQSDSEKKTSTSSDEDTNYNRIVKSATNILDVETMIGLYGE